MQTVYFNDPDGNSLELIAQLPVGLPTAEKVYLSEWKEQIQTSSLHKD